jgi:hypothetical protein
MASVTITFEDDPEDPGKVNIATDSDEGFSPESLTPAQSMALTFLDWLTKQQQQQQEGDQDNGLDETAAGLHQNPEAEMGSSAGD